MSVLLSVPEQDKLRKWKDKKDICQEFPSNKIRFEKLSFHVAAIYCTLMKRSFVMEDNL